MQYTAAVCLGRTLMREMYFVVNKICNTNGPSIFFYRMPQVISGPLAVLASCFSYHLRPLFTVHPNQLHYARCLQIHYFKGMSLTLDPWAGQVFFPNGLCCITGAE